jgi:Uma2 family endonuclease
MATATLQLGPADHGRKMTLEEYESATGREGYRYELIHGRVVVSPVPNLPHARVLAWINLRLVVYAEQHPAVINFVSQAGRMFLPAPDPDDVSVPEPDLVVYHDFPLDLPEEEVNWSDVSPVLVVEILSPDNADKDLDRNVELYLDVPSVREYWVFDPLTSVRYPSLRVFRRRGRRWQKPIGVPGRGTYTTRLLPGFELVTDIRR